MKDPAPPLEVDVLGGVAGQRGDHLDPVISEETGRCFLTWKTKRSARMHQRTNLSPPGKKMSSDFPIEDKNHLIFRQQMSPTFPIKYLTSF